MKLIYHLLMRSFAAAVLVILLLPLVAAFDLTQEMLYYDFDSPIGTLVIDSAFHKNASFTAGMGANVPGKINNTLNWTSGKHVTSNDSVYSELGQNFTINLWVKPLACGGRQSLINKGQWGNANQDYFVDFCANAGTEDVYFGTGTTGASWLFSASHLPLNDWSMVTVMRLTNTSTYIFINGVQDAHGTQNTPVVGNENMQIGAGQDGSNYQFNGYIDEVSVWNRSMTASEISSLYNGGNGLNPHAPVAEYLNLTQVLKNRYYNVTYTSATLSNQVDFNVNANFTNQSGAKPGSICNWTGYNISYHAEYDSRYSNYSINTSQILNLTLSKSPTNIVYDQYDFLACKTGTNVQAEVLINGISYRNISTVIPDCSAGYHQELNQTTAFNAVTAINMTIRCIGCAGSNTLRILPDFDGGLMNYERYFSSHTEKLAYNASTSLYENRSQGQYRQPFNPLYLNLTCDSTTTTYTINEAVGNGTIRTASIDNVTFVNGMQVESNTSYLVLFDASGFGIVQAFNVNLTYPNGSVISQFNALANESIIISKNMTPQNGVYNLTMYAKGDIGISNTNMSWFMINDTIDPVIYFVGALSHYDIGTNSVISGVCEDVNLFFCEMGIYDPVGLRYNVSYSNITTTSKTASVLVLHNVSGIWNRTLEAWDYHTKELISDWQYTASSDAGRIDFIFDTGGRYESKLENLTIVDITTDKVPVDIKKSSDRYSYTFYYKTAKSSLSYELMCKDAQLITWSKYNANFVCNGIHAWVDFETSGLAKTKITDCGQDCYRVDITLDSPRTQVTFASAGLLNHAYLTELYNVSEATTNTTLGYFTCPATIEGAMVNWLVFFIIAFFLLIALIFRNAVVGILSSLTLIFYSAVIYACFNILGIMVAGIGLVMFAWFCIMGVVLYVNGRDDSG